MQGDVSKRLLASIRLVAQPGRALQISAQFLGMPGIGKIAEGAGSNPVKPTTTTGIRQQSPPQPRESTCSSPRTTSAAKRPTRAATSRAVPAAAPAPTVSVGADPAPRRAAASAAAPANRADQPSTQHETRYPNSFGRAKRTMFYPVPSH